MSSMVRAVFAAVLGLALLAGPAFAQGPGTQSRQALLDELGADRVAFHSETGQLRFVAGTRADPSAPRERLGRPTSARAAATGFVARYGGLFGVRNPDRDLRLDRAIDAGAGRTFFRFRQTENGVPVLAGELTIQADEAGNVQSAIGEASPDTAEVDVVPIVPASSARRLAGELVARDYDARLAELSIPVSELWLYDPALLGADGPPDVRLVWLVEVHARAGEVNELVLVDAHDASIALRFSQVRHIANVSVCDAGGDIPPISATYPCTDIAADPAAETSPVEDVRNAFHFSTDYYDFFYDRFARDSIDGNGRRLVSTVRYCGANCAELNAFWNGSQATFHPGMATDDIVAHEFAHGFTQYTSSLFYYHQSGAINEALSDVFGELVDLTNGSADDTPEARWLMGEGSAVGPIRSMKDPPAFGHPDRIGSEHYWGSTSDNHGVHVNSGVANKAAFLMVDGETFNGQTVHPIGLDKTAAVWYRVASGYLGSGSDYADLGAALNQACTDLADGGTLVPADCDEVAKAVLATEMALVPTTPGATLPEPPLCETGEPVDLYLDQVAESSHPGWTSSDSFRWLTSTRYADSAPHSLWSRTPGSAGSATMRRTAAVMLPPDAYLVFRHAHLFEHATGSDSVRYYDGGLVQYRVGSGKWRNAGSLFTHNGYNGKVFSYPDGGNPLAGKNAFVGFSPGYVTSRLSLASLAGRNVRIGFRSGTDAAVGERGWFIDDVRLFHCPAESDASPPEVQAPNTKLRSGVSVAARNPRVRVSVDFPATDESGLSATQLQRRANDGSWSNVTLPTATATTKVLRLPPSPSTTRQFRARATDGEGYQSDWATGPAFRVVALQDGAADVGQAGSWTTGSNSKFFGRSVRFTTEAGASQAYTGVVSDLAFVTTRGPNRGIVEVFIDEAETPVATIDLYAPSMKFRQVVYAVDFGEAGAHTITIRATGAKNTSSTGTRVDLDAFLALMP